MYHINDNIEKALVGMDIENELLESGLDSMRLSCPKCGDRTLSARYTEAGNVSWLCYHSSCAERGVTRAGNIIGGGTAKATRPEVIDPLRINSACQIVEGSPLHTILSSQFDITSEEIINNNIRQSTLDELSAVFTILDYTGTPTGSIDRSYGTRTPKTINKLCANTPSGRHYAYTPAPITSLRTVVVVEDIVSAICCTRNHKVAAVSLLGTHMQESLMVELANKFDNVIVFLDADAMQKGANMVDLLSVFMKGKVNLCVDSHDPKDLPTDRLVAVINNFL